MAVQGWMEEQFGQSITMEDAASYAGLSSRHFKRRFKKATDETPLNYLQQIRMEAAKKYLETTMDNIDEITRQVGYEDASTFRRLFKKHTALSPREYRDKFAVHLVA
ncbi:MAG: helix-turn-helix domain-containing protein [Desulfatibacillum sp.]|nr:helix-turn-helix domain-containing protein [Desulfatibacillum sp.]